MFFLLALKRAHWVWVVISPSSEFRQADWPSLNTPTVATRALYESLRWLCHCGTSPQYTATAYFQATAGLSSEWPNCVPFSRWTYWGSPSLDGSAPIRTHGSRYNWACCRQQVVMRNDLRAPGGEYLYPPVVPLPVNRGLFGAVVAPVNPFIWGPPHYHGVGAWPDQRNRQG